MLHDGVHPHFWILADEEGYVLPVALNMLSTRSGASNCSRRLGLLRHGYVSHAIPRWLRVPGHRRRSGSGRPLQRLGVMLQAAFWGRLRPCGWSGHLLRLRRVLISCLIALGVPPESAADHSLTWLGSVSIALASAAGFEDPRFP